MKAGNSIERKIQTQDQLFRTVAQWRLLKKTVAFTNGCFDLLHAGHILSLRQAAAEADYLIVALNSDESVRKLKGPSRPLNPEDERALLIASLSMVDAVCIFKEDTPEALIKILSPDVLVKGGDYTVEQIAGSSHVLKNGGRVVINPILPGRSTTSIIDRIAHR